VDAAWARYRPVPLPEKAYVMLWTLEVRRSEFLDALRRIVPKSSKETLYARVVFTFSDGHLSVESIGGKVHVPATGTWPGSCAVPAELLKRLTRALPEEDPLQLKATDNQFTVSRLILPCECRATSEAAPQLYGELIPANLTLHEMLKLCDQHPAEAIEAAGLAPAVAAAQQKVDSILRRAATVLQPYGVTEEELMALVEKHAADTGCAFQDADKSVIKRVAEAWSLLAPLGIEAGEIKTLVDASIRNAWKR
jgi:hypothetical protein